MSHSLEYDEFPVVLSAAKNLYHNVQYDRRQARHDNEARRPSVARHDRGHTRHDSGYTRHDSQKGISQVYIEVSAQERVEYNRMIINTLQLLRWGTLTHPDCHNSLIIKRLRSTFIIVPSPRSAKP